MVKSKLMLPILAVIVGVAASAFTIKPKMHTTPVTHRADMFYFQFAGTPDQDEGQRTSWESIDEATYDDVACQGQHLGCKLIATDTVMLNGEAYPKEVYLQSGTNDPITGQYVDEVKNRQK